MARIIFCFLVFTCCLSSQTDSVYRFTLPELKITQTEKGKTVTYDFEHERNIFSLHDSMLTANPQKYNYNAALSDIRKIDIRDGNNFWSTAPILAAVGGTIGFLFGLGIYLAIHTVEEGFNAAIIPVLTVSGAIVGGIIGGIIGLGAPYYESYTLKEKDIRVKNEMLKTIFKRHNLTGNK